MDLKAILKQLREQRDQLNISIQAIERLAAGSPRGRGRPPKWLTDVATKPAKKRGAASGDHGAAKGE